MKKFVLAALAALTLGMGSAYAAQTNWVHNLNVHPAYSDDAPGGV